MRRARLTAEDRLALRRVRSQAVLVQSLSERLRRESTDGVRSVAMDGMPTGRGVCGGLEIRLERVEGLRRIVERESAELRRLEMRAREVMGKMTPEMYAFCVMYYIGGMSMEDAGEAIERSMSQCKRYRQEIEDMEDEPK